MSQKPLYFEIPEKVTLDKLTKILGVKVAKLQVWKKEDYLVEELQIENLTRDDGTKLKAVRALLVKP
jgi:hypothetical protein